MNYDGTIIRPPSEAASLILQITVGCSHNKCTFCPAYKEKKFRVKSTEEVFADIDEVACSGADDIRRVFLCDGDPLIISKQKLETIIDYIAAKFPRLQRIGIYGNAKSILRKSIEELRELKKKKLSIIYMGLESGDRVTLDKIKKGAAPEQMIEAAKRVRLAGIKLNVTVLLGIGGIGRSKIHAAETMRVLNLMEPSHVAALTLMLVPGTQAHTEFENEDFVLPGKFELIEELKIMIEESQLKNCLLFSNHASNYLPVKARLPRDKEQLVRELDMVISSKDATCLRNEFTRGL